MWWKCLCDCGEYISVSIGNLTSGRTTSCGCSREKFEDLVGKKYGLLTVTSFAGYIYDSQNCKRRIWNCTCDCGNIKNNVLEKSLKSGNVKSCGCLISTTPKKTAKKYKKYNRYELTEEICKGFDYKGDVFYFDLDDYEKIKEYCWIVKSNKYVESRDEDGKFISMHRVILDNPVAHVDHINHKTNDNRKCNLRTVTREQNQANSKLRIDNTSGVKGVYFDNHINKWVASIQENNIQHRKNFNEKIEAINYRKFLEEKYQGDYSYANSICSKGVG